MLIHPNHSSAYRNWAYCCAAIRKLTKEIEYCESGPIPAYVYFSYRYNGGSKAYMKNGKKEYQH